ncbi:MAG: SLBB domain-containing protein [Gemmatimonadetes bacterium]|nr:SLBB domain-containing protein [Gemmatimonadota bacterium]
MKTIVRFAQLAIVLSCVTPVARAQELVRPFQVGDRILLKIEGDSTLSDTFSVVAGPAIDLPVIGLVPLGSTKRADVQPYLTEKLSHYLREPIVRAKALVRISIEGEVTRPGFYAVPMDYVLGDALMAAGGLTPSAKVGDLKINRGGKDLLQGKTFEYAVAHETIDQLGLRAGDRILIPRRADTESRVRTLSILLGIPVAIFTITRLAL